MEQIQNPNDYNNYNNEKRKYNKNERFKSGEI